MHRRCCSPITRGYLASPDAPTRLRILVGKAIFIITATCFKSWPRLQTGLMVAAVTLITWFNFKKVGGRTAGSANAPN